MPSAPTSAVGPAAAPAAERCLVCGDALGDATITPRSSYATHGRFQIARCAGCGTGATWPRPTAAELDACYASTYGYGAHTLIEHEKRYRSRRLLDRAGLAHGRLLDVGCMFGFLLDEAARRGLETWGVELSPEPARAAAAHGHRVTIGTLDDHVSAHPDQRFDAIVAQHVVEHLPDPAGFFRQAAGLLAPGGRLVIAVPNFEARLRRLAPAAWGWYQVPVHLHHFTARGLRHLAIAAGLEVEAEAAHGGDTLFLALTALQAARRPVTGGDGDRASGGAARMALRAAGAGLRPYYQLGDDELVLVARRRT